MRPVLAPKMAAIALIATAGVEDLAAAAEGGVDIRLPSSFVSTSDIQAELRGKATGQKGWAE